MSTDPREFEHPIDGPTPNQLPTVLGVGSLTPEAIETAADVIWMRANSENGVCGADRQTHSYAVATEVATAALSAAYPLMEAQAKAEALREAADDLNPQLVEYRRGAHEVLTQKIKPTGGDDTRSLQLALVAAKQTANWLRARASIIEAAE